MTSIDNRLEASAVFTALAAKAVKANKVSMETYYIAAHSHQEAAELLKASMELQPSDSLPRLFVTCTNTVAKSRNPAVLAATGRVTSRPQFYEWILKNADADWVEVQF